MKFLKHLEHSFIGIAKEFRLSYMPPLMVYLAAGISGITGIVGTFFVKEHLGLSAEFLATLGFWMGVPWILKMPIGHIVDLIWKYKSIFVYIGASLLATSILIMVGLIGHKEFMEAHMSLEAWFVLSALLAPIGYVVQDVVADAMTIDAVPTVDVSGTPYSEAKLKAMHTTMQTLGTIAAVGGGIAVGLLNLYMFADMAEITAGLTDFEKANHPEVIAIYLQIYKMAFWIPIVSVLGVLLGWLSHKRSKKAMRMQGIDESEIDKLLNPHKEKTEVNWWIICGVTIYVLFVISIGLAGERIPLGQEIIFVGSLGIISFLMKDLFKHLTRAQRISLIAIAIILFVFRAMPSAGAGSTWWAIDVLKFDEHFFALLGVISGVIAFIGALLLRKWMIDKPIPYIIGFLVVVGAVLNLPEIGMFYGMHEWTAAMTNGVVDARFIAIIDTALDSPLARVAMIPMLAWIAHTAPRHLKATFFAVMTSFVNLALSGAKLGTKYLNQIFEVTREVRNDFGEIIVHANYSDLGTMFIIVTIIALVVPLLTIAIFGRWAK